MSTEHLKQKLDGLKGKITFYGFLYGIGIFLAFLAGAFLVLFALDQIPESFNVGLQGVLWRLRVMILGVVALMIFVFRRYIMRPVGEHWNHDDLALLVEKEYKELNDSLISTVQFERGNLPEHFNSPQLVKATIEKTVRETESMNFTRGVRGSMAFMAFVIAFVCFGANVASAVVFDEAFSLFGKRMVAAVTFGNPPMKPQQTFLEVTIRVKEKNSRLEREKIPVMEKDENGNPKISVIPVPKGDSITVKAVVDKRRSVIFPGTAYIVRSTTNGDDYTQEDLMNAQNMNEYDFAEESQAYIRDGEARLKTISSQFSGREKDIPQRYRDEKAELERNLAIMAVDLNKIDSDEQLKVIAKYADKDKIVANLKALRTEVEKMRGECRTSVEAMNAAAPNTPASIDKVRSTVNAFMDYRRNLEGLRNELEEEAGTADVMRQKNFAELAGLESIYRNALEARRATLEKSAPRGRQWNELRKALNVLPIRKVPENYTGVSPQQRQVFFSNQITEVNSSFMFYISCGDSFKANITRDLSQHYEIRVIERPNTVSMNVYRVEPEYVDANQRSVRLEEGSDLSALLGTRVQVSTKTNKPKGEVKRATLVYADSAGNVINTNPDENAMKWVEYYVVEENGDENYVKKDDTPVSVDASKKSSRVEQWLEGEFTVTQTGRYWVALTDNYNYTNIEHKVYEVVALKDKLPTLDVYYPDQKILRLTKQASMPLKMTAKDDRNVKELVVRYQVGANTNPVDTFNLVPASGIETPSRLDPKVKVMAPPDATASAQDQLSHSAVVIVGDDYKDGSKLNIPRWPMKSVGMYLSGDTKGKAKPEAKKEPAKPEDKVEAEPEAGPAEEASELDSEHRPLQVTDTVKYWVECSDYYNGKESHTIKSKEFEIVIANDSEVQAIVEDGIRNLLKEAGQARKDSEENYAKIDLAKQNLSGEGMEEEAEATEEVQDAAKAEAEAKAKEDSRRQNVRAKIDAARIQVATNVRLTEKIAAEVKSLSDYIEMNQLPRMGDVPSILDFCATELKNINENYAEELVIKLKKSAIFDEDQEKNLEDAMDTQKTITDSLMTIESQLSNGVGMIALIVRAQKIEERLDKTTKEMESIRAPKKDEAAKPVEPAKPGEPVKKP